MEQLSQEQINTAMKSPEHLQEWLRESGRRWLTFNTKDLIDAVGIVGAQALAGLISAYRDHRRTISTGRVEKQMLVDPVTGQEVEVETPIHKDETLEIEELDRAIRHFIGLASEKDPNWSLQNTPL